MFLLKCLLLDENVINKSIKMHKNLEIKEKRTNSVKDIIKENLETKIDSKGKFIIKTKLILKQFNINSMHI